MIVFRSTPVLNLTITFQPLSMFKWQMYSAQQLKNRSELSQREKKTDGVLI